MLTCLSRVYPQSFQLSDTRRSELIRTLCVARSNEIQHRESLEEKIEFDEDDQDIVVEMDHLLSLLSR